MHAIHNCINIAKKGKTTLQFYPILLEKYDTKICVTCKAPNYQVLY